MTEGSPSFRAYGSKKQALVVIAAFAPMLTSFAWALVINSTYPIAVRLGFALLIGVSALILVGPLHRLVTRGPVLEVGEDGFCWRGWSGETIPWEAVERWKPVTYLGTRYVTLWLCDPARHPASTAARWTQWANGWFGQGDISIPGGGLNRSFDDIARAFGRLAPKPPLPDDPRLARRLQRARDRRDRDGAA